MASKPSMNDEPMVMVPVADAVRQDRILRAGEQLCLALESARMELGALYYGKNHRDVDPGEIENATTAIENWYRAYRDLTGDPLSLGPSRPGPLSSESQLALFPL